jgi:hypothetical protein
MLRNLADISLGDIPGLLLISYAGFYFADVSHEFGHYFAARFVESFLVMW